MSKLFSLVKTVSESNRLRILCLLSRSEICVCELEGILGLSQPLVSAHLKALKKVGLVRDRREGKWAYCSLNPKRLKKERTWLLPLIKRSRKEPPFHKDERLLVRCLCYRVNGKCVSRFNPARKILI